MEYLSDLDHTSRAFTILLLSIVCVELAVFAFGWIKRLVCEVRVAWRVGRMAFQLWNEAREQAKRAQIDQLTQQLGALAAIDLNEGDGELDAAKLLDVLERRLLAD